MGKCCDRPGSCRLAESLRSEPLAHVAPGAFFCFDPWQPLRSPEIRLILVTFAGKCPVDCFKRGRERQKFQAIPPVFGRFSKLDNLAAQPLLARQPLRSASILALRSASILALRSFIFVFDFSEPTVAARFGDQTTPSPCCADSAIFPGKMTPGDYDSPIWRRCERLDISGFFNFVC